MQVMLTTIDNPYDYFNEFENWLAFDEEKGYDTLNYLARIAETSDELSDLDNEIAIDSAIDAIINLNILGIYKKVYKNQ